MTGQTSYCMLNYVLTFKFQPILYDVINALTVYLPFWHTKPGVYPAGDDSYFVHIGCISSIG